MKKEASYEHYGVDMKDRKFGVKIIMHHDKFMSAIRTTVYYNKGFRFEPFHKWSWYFDYRMVLFKVKNPKFYFEMLYFDYIEVASEDEERIRHKAKITARKRKLTIARNKIENYKSSWDSIFPIDDDPTYLAALLKMMEYETNLNQFIKEYQEKYGKL